MGSVSVAMASVALVSLGSFFGEGAVFLGVAWTFRQRVTYRSLRREDGFIADEDEE